MNLTIAALLATLALGITAANAVEAKTKPYPSKICIVTDNKLGSMGRIITKTHEGQEVKFCCKPCVKKFDKDPKKYLAKLGSKK